jgi:hypothetical protein
MHKHKDHTITPIHYILIPSVFIFNPYPANVENRVSSYASKWQMGFNSAFKGLMKEYDITVCNNDPYLTVQKVFRK